MQQLGLSEVGESSVKGGMTARYPAGTIAVAIAIATRKRPAEGGRLQLQRSRARHSERRRCRDVETSRRETNDARTKRGQKSQRLSTFGSAVPCTSGPTRIERKSGENGDGDGGDGDGDAARMRCSFAGSQPCQASSECSGSLERGDWLLRRGMGTLILYFPK